MAVAESDPANTKVVVNGKDGPWWVRELKYFIAVIGIPGVICGFLLWERSTVMKEFTRVLSDVTIVLREIKENLPKNNR